MIIRQYIIGLIAITFSITIINAQDYHMLNEDQKTINFFDIQKTFYKRYAPKTLEQTMEYAQEKEGGYYQFKKWEWYWKQRVWPTGDFPQPQTLYSIYKKEKQRKYTKNAESTLSLKPNWRNLGPTDIPSGGGAGRVNGIHIPTGQSSIYWAASAGGGAWKSTNSGKTWECKTDELGSLGITDIATENGNPNIVYLATGDGFGADTYFGALAYSIGLMKSTDGGNTWQETGLNYQQSNGRVLTRVIVHPENKEIIIAAGNTGIFKSTDGGKTFALKFNGNIKDLEIKPGSAAVWYATAGSKIYKSTDTGDKWTEMKSGIPGSIGRIAIAVTPADPEAIYAVTARSNSWDFGGFYRSYDGGTTWEGGATSPNIIGRNLQGTDNTDQQGWYDLCIAASPDNADIIYVGGINIWRSTNGGNNWAINTYWVGNSGKPYVHADIHDLDFVNSSTLVAGCDGGVFQTTNKGINWGDISNGLEIMQFYKIGISQSDSNVIIGGAQDNGTSLRTSLGENKWRQVWGGDGMDCSIDPINSNNIMVSSQNGNAGRSTDGGKSFRSSITTSTTGESGEWVTPIIYVPGNPSKAFAGYRNLWRSDDAGGFWNKTSEFPNKSSSIIFISYAPSNPDIMIVSNFNGIFKTTDAGKTWKPALFPIDPGSITSVVFHPNNPDMLWCSISGFGPNKVYQSNDGATTKNWINISSGMPSIPVNNLIYQPNSPDRLYAGTDLGVYYRDTSTKVWIPYNEGMPNVVVTDLEIQYATNSLIAGTYGRGVWKGDLVSCPALTCSVNVIGDLTFCQGDSVILQAQNGFQNYKWSTGETTSSIIVKKTGVYSLTVYTADGCPSGAGPFNVTENVRPKPVISVQPINPISTVICDKKPLVLDAGTMFTSYKWSTGDTTRKITVDKPGSYSVIVTNKVNCLADTLIIVTEGISPDKPSISIQNDSLISSVAAYYQWQLDSTDIKDATSQVFKLPKFTNIRKYRVKVSNEAGCPSVSDALSISSVHDYSLQSGFIVYPNPTQSLVHISYPSAINLEECTIQFVNSIGIAVPQSMYSIQYGQNNISLQIESLPAASYWLQIISKQHKQYIIPIVKY